VAAAAAAAAVAEAELFASKTRKRVHGSPGELQERGRGGSRGLQGGRSEAVHDVVGDDH
jgi:hypothetical protein